MATPANPNQIQQLIQLLNSGQLAKAEQLAKLLIQQHPNTFILHHVLSLALDGQQKYADAANSYRNALKLEPKHPELLFNLGIVLTQLDDIDEAANCYQQAIKLNPRFFEAHGNLGTLYQRQGQLEKAITSYQAGLAINPQDARGYFNLGTALRDSGKLAEAIISYRKAIQLFPNYTDAYNNLGETLRDKGEMEEAVQAYLQALALNPEHPNANYNMGEFLYLAKKFDEAVTHFDRSQLDDWQARSLYCLYKAQHFDEFKTRLDEIVRSTRHTAPFIATLATHYSINFGVENPYNFCKNGFDFVYHASIPELAAPDSPLLKQLLDDIEHTDIAERVQGMLHHGQQSAGNLFKRPEASFRQLGELVKREFQRYRAKFAAADCELIQSFPDTLEFTSSWYVRMRKGGHLDAHIHEIGWISGAVYLAMPPSDGRQGAFEYGTHGDDYPKQHENFPVQHVLPKAGDIVLFPSSLFHRTIPFESDSTRICVAFDLMPATPSNSRNHY